MVLVLTQFKISWGYLSPVFQRSLLFCAGGCLCDSLNKPHELMTPETGVISETAMLSSLAAPTRKQG